MNGYVKPSEVVEQQRGRERSGDRDSDKCSGASFLHKGKPGIDLYRADEPAKRHPPRHRGQMASARERRWKHREQADEKCRDERERNSAGEPAVFEGVEELGGKTALRL